MQDFIEIASPHQMHYHQPRREPRREPPLAGTPAGTPQYMDNIITTIYGIITTIYGIITTFFPVLGGNLENSSFTCMWAQFCRTGMIFFLIFGSDQKSKFSHVSRFSCVTLASIPRNTWKSIKIHGNLRKILEIYRKQRKSIENDDESPQMTKFRSSNS